MRARMTYTFQTKFAPLAAAAQRANKFPRRARFSRVEMLHLRGTVPAHAKRRLAACSLQLRSFKMRLRRRSQSTPGNAAQ